MKRRSFLKLTGSGLAGLAFGSSMLSCGNSEMAQPNIVLIMADDLGWNELGCYGQEKIRTPNIDRLAEQGMTFSQFYAGSAVCAPSRCNLMTGMHAGHAYVRSNKEIPNPEPGIFGGQVPLPAETRTVAEVLKEQGYTTGCFGKWGLGAVDTSGDPLNQGFDRFYGYNGQRHAHNLYPRYLVSDKENVFLDGNSRGLTGKQYAPQLIADQMLEWVDAQGDQPFFLYYPTVIPHLPLQVPDEYLEEYEGMWEETPYTGDRYQPHPTPRAAYAAMITFMDAQVGRLLKLLQQKGLEENTVVLFTSDNGATLLNDQVDVEFFNSVGPLRGLKGSLHEGGIRVPLVARWPGKIDPGSSSAHISAHYDMPATLADMAGTSMEESTDGISMVDALTGQSEQQEAHDYLFWDFSGYGGQLAVRMGQWKGIKKGLKQNPDAPLELYNLEEDIAEQNNVVDSYPGIAEQIERIMLEARTVPEIEEFQFGRYSESA